ncbi:hypothetical protein CMV_018479 [Castanea mollissima]|uniref:Uncharacterized protein n=1 Tax=Castanea mollissima TaxID=60419 RepID=A0A8J4QUZ9_9ROSI|nr:hypothetical protein CMV_018479 [Castanea mollissima]
MLVTRRKNSVQSGRARSASKENQGNDVSSQGNIVFRGINKEGKEAEVMAKSPQADFPHSNQGHSRGRSDLSEQSVAVEELSHMESRQEASGSGMVIMSSQSEGMRGSQVPIPRAKKVWALRVQNLLNVNTLQLTPKLHPSFYLLPMSIEASFQGRNSLTRPGWAIWHQGKPITVSNELILQIRVAPTEKLSWCDEGLGKAWKKIFSITPSSIKTGLLPLDHPAWGKEVGGFQGSGNSSYGESPNAKASADSSSCEEMQHANLLQGGCSGNPEIYDGLEIRMEEFQGPLKENGMEYGGAATMNPSQVEVPIEDADISLLALTKQEIHATMKILAGKDSQHHNEACDVNKNEETFCRQVDTNLAILAA